MAGGWGGGVSKSGWSREKLRCKELQSLNSEFTRKEEEGEESQESPGVSVLESKIKGSPFSQTEKWRRRKQVRNDQ